MASTVQDSLLGKEQGSLWFSCKAKMVAAASACLLLSLGCLAMFTKILAQHFFDGPPSGVPPTQMLVDVMGSPSCLKFAGQSCLWQGCPAELNQTCITGSHCACAGNHECIGGDGTCWSNITQYHEVATNVRLRNVHWNDSYVYSPTSPFMNQLRVYTTTGKADKWTFYRLPGHVLGASSRKTAYMIQNDHYPTYAAGVMQNRFPFFGGGSYKVQVINTQKAGFGPAMALSSICRNEDNSIRIDGYADADEVLSWYIRRGSYKVFGYPWNQEMKKHLSSYLGARGHWKLEPEFPPGVLESFEECKFD